MKLGIGLPNTMSHEIDRSLMLDWARLADEAGFDVLGTIDKPNYDAWEPLATLAGVSGVTERSGSRPRSSSSRTGTRCSSRSRPR